MVIDDLYGFLGHNLDAAKDELESALQIKMVAREGLHNGGDYFNFRNNMGEHFKIRNNLDLEDNVPVEDDFPDYSLILYVEGLANLIRAKEVEEKITMPAKRFVLLRRDMEDD
jgi:hypothetical protein